MAVFEYCWVVLWFGGSLKLCDTVSNSTSTSMFFLHKFVIAPIQIILFISDHQITTKTKVNSAKLLFPGYLQCSLALQLINFVLTCHHFPARSVPCMCNSQSRWEISDLAHCLYFHHQLCEKCHSSLSQFIDFLPRQCISLAQNKWVILIVEPSSLLHQLCIRSLLNQGVKSTLNTGFLHVFHSQIQALSMHVQGAFQAFPALQLWPKLQLMSLGYVWTYAELVQPSADLLDDLIKRRGRCILIVFR